MIQKKYMWGLVLGLLGLNVLVQDMNASRRRSRESEAVGEIGGASWLQMSSQEYEAKLQALTGDDIEQALQKLNTFKDNSSLSSQYRNMFKDQYNFLLGLQKSNEPEQSEQNIQGQGQNDQSQGSSLSSSSDSSDLSSSGTSSSDSSLSSSAENEIVASVSSDSGSSVEASDAEKAAALKALMRLSDNLTLSQPITNQTEWKAFCNSFATLVERGEWKPENAYKWNGSELK